MATLMLVLALAAWGQPGDARPGGDPLRGRYVARAPDGASCDLAITAAAAFVVRCQKQPPVEGVVHHVQTTIVLTAKNRETLDWPDERRYWTAAGLYMQQHLKEHGFYPLVVPPPLPEYPDGTGCMMVPVVFGNRLFLVDVFERAAFCDAARAGREPRGSNRHPIFRTRSKEASGGLSSAEFCQADWKPFPEHEDN